MSRRAPKKKSYGQSVGISHGGNHCRAMVRVDGTGARNKIKKEYEKALRELEKSRRLLEQFEQTDQPQYTRWMSSQFGALLTELRELEAKIAADEELVFLVEGEVMFGGGSYASAYKRVMELRNNPAPPPPSTGEEEGGKENPFRGPGDGREEDDADDPLRAFFESLFGKLPGDGGYEGPRHPGRERRQERKPGRDSRRLKDLYRAVVRRLHPDRQKEMTAQKTEWWHQAQAAYQAGDVEQLEVILTLCEIDESGTTAQTTVGLLQRITAQLKDSLRAMKRQITGLRHEPAWNFSKRTDNAELAEGLRARFVEDLEEMRGEWRDLQDRIGRWKAAAEKVKPSRRRKAGRSQPEFLF